MQGFFPVVYTEEDSDNYRSGLRVVSDALTHHTPYKNKKESNGLCTQINTTHACVLGVCRITGEEKEESFGKNTRPAIGVAGRTNQVEGRGRYSEKERRRGRGCC